jgi:zinc/manganese transport system substrate-binding protein
MILIFVAMLMLASSLPACGGGGDAGVEVVATTGIAADIVRHVAEPDARVDSLLSGSASPHDYGATPKDRARLEDADLVVAWGAGLEAGLPLDDLDDEPFELAAGEHDPHIWMDPTRVAGSLGRLARALGRADPEHADAYAARARRYARSLMRLDRELRRTLARIPPDNRKLVTSHDALGHFARHYGFEFVGAPFGLTPGSEPSAEKVSDLIDHVESQHVPAVFAEDTDDPEVIKEIGRAAGVDVVDDLIVENFGDRVDSYEDMLRFDAGRVAGALGG